MMKPRGRRIAILAGGIVALGLCVLIVLVAPLVYEFFNNPFNDKPFRRDVWLTAGAGYDFHSPRGPMADDLRSHYLRKGMTKQAVRALLGKPDNSEYDEKRGNIDNYYLGYWGGMPIDPCYLAINYDGSGRLVSTGIWEG